jgi:hypothetical protein
MEERMANIMQTNLDTLTGKLRDQHGYVPDGRIEQTLAWLASDDGDWPAWPKVMREALCESDFAYVLSPLAQGVYELATAGKASKETLGSLKRRMARRV